MFCGAGALAFAAARPALALTLVAASACLIVWSRFTPTAAAGAGGKAAPPPAKASGLDQRFALAVRDFRAGSYAVAFEQFSRQADEGHTRAARVVLRMLSHGLAAYGIAIPVGNTQVARWRATAQAGGADPARQESFTGNAALGQ